MPCYHLRTNDLEHPLHTIARGRDGALLALGKELGCELTFDEIDGSEIYLMDEWPENSGPHWVNPTIRVYVKR